MKKLLIQSGLIVVVLVIITIFSQAAKGSEIIDNPNNYFGEKAEDVNGILHKVEIHPGSYLYTNNKSMIDGLNLEVYPEDKVEIFPDPSLGVGSIVKITRASIVLIVDGGEEKVFRTWKNTVGEVLAENNIQTDENDKVNPSPDTSLSMLMTDENRNVVSREGRTFESPIITTINITRVSETEMVETEEIAYKTITKKDADLERGVTKVSQVGRTGLKKMIYSIRKENGEIVDKNLVSTEVIREPEDKIILEGTKVITYGTGIATWYDWIGGMTAASNTLPNGTMVKVINTANGKSVEVKIVDHGIQGSAVIDLSDEAYSQLAPLGTGKITVRLEKP